jgi:hypothetical protein
MNFDGKSMTMKAIYGIIKHVVTAGSSMLLAKGYIYNVYPMKNSMAVRISMGNAAPEQSIVTQGKGTINESLHTDDHEVALSSRRGTSTTPSPTYHSDSQKIIAIPNSESTSESVAVLYGDSDKDVEDQRTSVDLLVKHYPTLLTAVDGNISDCPICSNALSPSQQVI